MDSKADLSEGSVELTEIPTDKEQFTVEPGPPTYQSLNLQHQTMQQLPYGNIPQMGQEVVTMQPVPAVPMAITARAPRPPSANEAIILSTCVLILCNPPAGCIALIFAIMARIQYGNGKQQQGGTMVYASKFASIVGIVSTSIVLLSFVFYIIGAM